MNESSCKVYLVLLGTVTGLLIYGQVYKHKLITACQVIEQQEQVIEAYQTKLHTEKVINQKLEDHYKKTMSENINNQRVQRSMAKASRGKSLAVPNVNSNFKSYMDINKITSKSSAQYKFIDSNRESIWTDDYGCKRLNDDYLVAMGTAYGNVGDRFDITFASGDAITVTKSEVKADIHTDPNNMYHLNDKSVIEFLVDTNKLHKTIKRDGGLHNIPGFKGSITKIVHKKD